MELKKEAPKRWKGWARAWKGGASEEGSSLVEFAFVLSILLFLMLGIMDFSRFLYTYHFVSDAAREGTRYAAVRGYTFHGTGCSSTQPYACDAVTSDIQNYVKGLAPLGIFSNQLTVTPSWPETTPDTKSGSTSSSCTTNANTAGCYVQVLVSYPYKFMFGSFLPRTSGTWTINSTSEVVIQQ